MPPTRGPPVSMSALQLPPQVLSAAAAAAEAAAAVAASAAAAKINEDDVDDDDDEISVDEDRVKDNVCNDQESNTGEDGGTHQNIGNKHALKNMTSLF